MGSLSLSTFNIQKREGNPLAKQPNPDVAGDPNPSVEYAEQHMDTVHPMLWYIDGEGHRELHPGPILDGNIYESFDKVRFFNLNSITALANKTRSAKAPWSWGLVCAVH